VSAQKMIISDELDGFLSALVITFASYFVFNLEYNPSCVATLEFIQREMCFDVSFY